MFDRRRKGFVSLLKIVLHVKSRMGGEHTDSIRLKQKWMMYAFLLEVIMLKLMLSNVRCGYLALPALQLCFIAGVIKSDQFDRVSH